MGALNEPEIYVAFSIGKHDLDADECSRLVGIPPTRVWRQTRPHLMQWDDVPNTQWIIESQRVRSSSVDEEVKGLLNRLSPSRERIASFVEKSGARANVCCNVTIYHDRPDYALSAPIVRAIAELGAGFMLDIFDYSQDSENCEDAENPDKC